MVVINILQYQRLGIFVGNVSDHESGPTIIFDLLIICMEYSILVDLESDHFSLWSELSPSHLLLLKWCVGGVQRLKVGVWEFMTETNILVKG